MKYKNNFKIKRSRPIIGKHDNLKFLKVRCVQKIGYPNTYFLFRPSGQEVEVTICDNKISPKCELYDHEKKYIEKYVLKRE